MNALLGKRIRSFRTDRDLTQEYVAEYLGISRQKYARIENGAVNITLDILIKVAELFQIEVSDITKVLDKDATTAYRKGESQGASVNTVYDMLDLFYANKHAYERMTYKDKE